MEQFVVRAVGLEASSMLFPVISFCFSGTQHLRQDIIAQDPATHGAMLSPVILGSDKTTVSVATGNTEFHPVYMSCGNLHNEMRRGHCDAVVPVAFLAIPKGK